MVRQANIKGRHQILDLGCGTGTLGILIKKSHPDAEVFGLDADASILEIAKEKASRAKVDLILDQGMAQSFPYPYNSFARVLSSLVFHHLNTKDKQQALQEAYRVLKPGGELHVADFGKPSNIVASVISSVVRRFEEVAENIKGLLPEMMSEAGITHQSIQSQYMTASYPNIFGLRSRIHSHNRAEEYGDNNDQTS